MANDRDYTLEITRMVEEMSLVFDAAASLVAFNGKILLQNLLLYRYAEEIYI